MFITMPMSLKLEAETGDNFQAPIQSTFLKVTNPCIKQRNI